MRSRYLCGWWRAEASQQSRANLAWGSPPLVSRSFRRACAVFRPRLYDHRLTILRLRENRMRQSFFDNEPESKWSRSVPERLQQMASHESPRTTKFYDRTKGQGMLRWRGRATHVSARSLILSTLITGLDGRSNFERNGGALAPLLHLPLARCYGQTGR